MQFKKLIKFKGKFQILVEIKQQKIKVSLQ